MNEIEINEGNCVLDEQELEILDTILKSAVERANDKMLAKSYLNLVSQKIRKLNEMAKELHTRNLSVKTIIKFHDIGKQAEEKQNERG